MVSVSSAVASPLLSAAFVLSAAAAINANAITPSHRVTSLPATATESPPLKCRHRRLSPMMHLSSATKAIITYCSPRAGHLSPPLSLPLVHCCRPLSSAVAASLGLGSSRLPTLPYLVADSQVVAPSGPHRTLSDARGAFPAAAAMVVMVVVVGRWRLGGTILWCKYDLFSEASPARKTLGSYRAGAAGASRNSVSWIFLLGVEDAYNT